MLYIDSDNALGSWRGDVDDGFAVAALLCSGLPVAALASVFGNTSEARADRNNRALGRVCGFTGPYLRGAGSRRAAPAEAARFLASAPGPLRVVALGPLTNVAAALRLDPAAAARFLEVVLVGANASSRGRWPPLWPFEFNLWLDRAAARAVFEAPVPLTIVPLDAARHLRVTRSDLEAVPGAIGQHLRRDSVRWFRRARLLYWSSSIPLWDLAAALYVLEPALFSTAERSARMHGNGWIELGASGRAVRLVRGFDRNALWNRFVSLF